MSPCVVFAWKFGATLPSLSRGCSSVTVARLRRTKGEVEGRAAGLMEVVKFVRERGDERVNSDAIAIASKVLKSLCKLAEYVHREKRRKCSGTFFCHEISRLHHPESREILGPSQLGIEIVRKLSLI